MLALVVVHATIHRVNNQLIMEQLYPRYFVEMEVNACSFIFIYNIYHSMRYYISRYS